MLMATLVHVDGQVAVTTSKVHQTSPHALVCIGAHAVIAGGRFHIQELHASACRQVHLHPLCLILKVLDWRQEGGVGRARTEVEEAVVRARTDGGVANDLDAGVRGRALDALNLRGGAVRELLANLRQVELAVAIGRRPPGCTRRGGRDLPDQLHRNDRIYQPEPAAQ